MDKIQLQKKWARRWMRYASAPLVGPLAARLACIGAPPGEERVYLSRFHPNGFISPTAQIHHGLFNRGKNTFIGDRTVILQRQTAASADREKTGGEMVFGDRVVVYSDCTLHTGRGASLHIGRESSIHSRAYIMAYLEPIEIGSGVMVAPNCAFYSYDHGFAADEPIRLQALRSKGPIVVGDEAWIGYGSIVLSGVTIGSGAVIGAGSIVMQDIPENAIAVGAPAKVVGARP